MKIMTTILMIGFTTLAVCSAATAGTDKTLVSWVCLANTTQQGGSALTIQRGEQFDGIVFGEREAGRWMAGSEGFARTQGNQQANAVEQAGRDTLIQMAVVYQGNRIALYRDGEPYASYDARTLTCWAPATIRPSSACGTSEPPPASISRARLKTPGSMTGRLTCRGDPRIAAQPGLGDQALRLVDVRARQGDRPDRAFPDQ